MIYNRKKDFTKRIVCNVIYCFRLSLTTQFLYINIIFYERFHENLNVYLNAYKKNLILYIINFDLFCLS